GRLFDVLLLVLIVASVAVVMLESVPAVRDDHGWLLIRLEWLFTILFTMEYLLRLYSVRAPWKYATSFFGVVDLLAVLPTYLSLLIPGAQAFLVIRILRVLRIFRVFKLAGYLNESRALWVAIKASSRKIFVFLFAIINIVVVTGAIVYVIEGPARGFSSIPTSIYWAVVTLTTVGYGDIVPLTTAGKLLSMLLMLLGYGIIAVPTGIVSAEVVQVVRGKISTQACPSCGAEGHQYDAVHCRKCGEKL
ncbi:MAG TPA: ion transporter, partial [Gemmatimonadales bacterium]|nr:ion transporter [Gemmatimonadales bacterium]